MAHATHLTIGTADRIRLDARPPGRGREDEDGENEVRQEVQVNITYALEAGDTDLVLLAEAKALEVQWTHEAVWNRIGAFSGNLQGSDCAHGGSGLVQCSLRHDGEEEDETDGPDDDPLAGARPFLTDTLERDSPFPTASVTPIHSGHASTSAEIGPDGDPLTGPQRILIGSRAKKAELTPYALEALVFKQFRVWKIERLSKKQATTLLDALDRDLTRNNTEQKDGRQGLSYDNNSGSAVTTGTA